MADPVAFCDTETTGIRPDVHEIWEVGLILPDGSEHSWMLPVDITKADPIALSIGKFHERHPQGNLRGADHSCPDLTSPRVFAADFARLTHGLHIAGAVISFDDKRLERLMLAHSVLPSWHYHIVDTEALVVGYLRGNPTAWHLNADGVIVAHGKTYATREELASIAQPPWDSDALSFAVGVDPAEYDRHTALGDCRWAKALYAAVMGDPVT